MALSDLSQAVTICERIARKEMAERHRDAFGSRDPIGQREGDLCTIYFLFPPAGLLLTAVKALTATIETVLLLDLLVSTQSQQTQ